MRITIRIVIFITIRIVIFITSNKVCCNVIIKPIH